MLSNATIPTFLELRLIAYVFISFGIVAWTFGQGFNLKAKANLQGVTTGELVALTLSLCASCFSFCALVAAGLSERFAKGESRRYWLTTVRGEACWVFVIAFFHFGAAVAISISRSYFLCPTAEGSLGFLSCQGINNGILLFSWFFAIVAVVYGTSLLSHAHKLVRLWKPVLDTQVNKVKWNDPSYYYNLQKAESVDVVERERKAVAAFEAMGRLESGRTTEKSKPLPLNANPPVVASKPKLVISLPRPMVPRNPPNPSSSSNSSSNSSSSEKIPSFSNDITTQAQATRRDQRTPTPRSKSKGVRQLVLVNPSRTTSTASSRSPRSQSGRRVERGVYEISLPTDFRHVPVPRIGDPPASRRERQKPLLVQTTPIYNPSTQTWYRPTKF